MRRPCEICAQNRPGAEVESERYVRIENRVVALCSKHAHAVKKAGTQSLSDLQTQFKESTGARSLLPRRGASNRRLFPARPEGRRCSDGRRWDDSLND
ncbi:MAG TPA: hypothetical protein VL137_04565 [Polyangiaceae bacterium]|nr:hypothetical protein [Polyangiaceae bacterium]